MAFNFTTKVYILWAFDMPNNRVKRKKMLSNQAFTHVLQDITETHTVMARCYTDQNLSHYDRATEKST